MLEHDHAVFAESQPIASGLASVAGRAELRLISPAEADHARWDALGRDPASPSIFAQPWFTRAGLRHCQGGDKALLAVVSDRDGDWVGVLPLVSRLRYGKAPFPHWAAWDHPNQFRGTPLVRRGDAARFWRTLLAGLDSGRFGRLALRLNGLPLDDQVTLALTQVCAETGRACKIDRRYARAALRVDQPDDPGALKPSRRRRIASLERKAERELGPLAWRISRASGEVEPALGRFLALERAGWKGAVGSALDCAADTSAFVAAIADPAARAGRIEIAELVVGDRVLAASVHFIGPREGFGYKLAYDETLAAYGPGLLLLNRLTGHFRAGGMKRIDSCCAPGQEPIGSLWPDRLDLVDCGIALGSPLLRRGLGLLGLAEAFYRGTPLAA
jgi:CelD/BcsL family acetyltransferase involved in cellulose biosynthesis